MSMPFTDDEKNEDDDNITINNNNNKANKIRIEQEKICNSYYGLSEIDVIKIDYAFKEGIIKGFKVFNIKPFIIAKTKINISDKFVKRIRIKYIKENKSWFLQYAKDAYAYVGIYRKAIDEIEMYKEELWKIILNPSVEHLTKVACFREMHALTKTGVLMAKDLPFIMNISKYFDYNKMDKHDTRSIYDKVAGDELEHSTKEYNKYYLDNMNEKLLDNIINNNNNNKDTNTTNRENTGSKSSVAVDDVVSNTIMDQVEKFSMKGIEKKEKKKAEDRYLDKIVSQVDEELDNIVKNENIENKYEDIKQKASNFLSYLDEVVPKETRDTISRLREFSEYDNGSETGV